MEKMQHMQHTPLKHAQKCAFMVLCQSSPTSAKSTARCLPTLTKSKKGHRKALCGELVFNAALKMSDEIGPHSKRERSKLTAVSAPVVGLPSRNFSPLIMRMETAKRTATTEFVGTNYINGLKREDIPQTGIGCFVSIAIARAVNLGSVRTKNNAIAKAEGR